MTSTKTQVFSHFYIVVCSLFVLFYEERVTSESDQNLKATKIRLWLQGIEENEEEKTISTTVCSTCIMAPIFVLFQVASNLN